jgi:hypothetical protein
VLRRQQPEGDLVRRKACNFSADTRIMGASSYGWNAGAKQRLRRLDVDWRARPWGAATLSRHLQRKFRGVTVPSAFTRSRIVNAEPQWKRPRLVPSEYEAWKDGKMKCAESAGGQTPGRGGPTVAGTRNDGSHRAGLHLPRYRSRDRDR